MELGKTRPDLDDGAPNTSRSDKVQTYFILKNRIDGMQI